MDWLQSRSDCLDAHAIDDALLLAVKVLGRAMPVVNRMLSCCPKDWQYARWCVAGLDLKRAVYVCQDRALRNWQRVPGYGGWWPDQGLRTTSRWQMLFPMFSSTVLDA
jgi:hypothetical protein